MNPALKCLLKNGCVGRYTLYGQAEYRLQFEEDPIEARLPIKKKEEAEEEGKFFKVSL